MSNCLYCNRALLRHISSSELYWYCSSCRQKMPILRTKFATNTRLRWKNINPIKETRKVNSKSLNIVGIKSY